MTHEEYIGLRKIDNLDWLRGISILLVIFHHVPKLSSDHWFAVFQGNGRYGVSLFFTVSGFLICNLLLIEKERHGHIDIRAFYIRRTLRLFPLYYAVLAVYCIQIFVFHQYSPENQLVFRERLPFHLLFLSNMTENATTGAFFFAWSLAVEEQFYIFFSSALYFLRNRAVVIVVSGALLLKPVLILLLDIDRATIGWRIALSYQEGILWGVLVAFALRNPGTYRFISWTSKTVPLVINASICVFLLMFYELHDKSGPVTQLFYLSVALVIAGVVGRPRVPVLGNRLMMHVGKISYGIYLLHMTVIIVVQKLVTDNPWLVFATSTLGVLLTASLVYRYFESPILKLKSNFSRI